MKRKMLAMLTAGAIVLLCGYGAAAEEILDAAAGPLSAPSIEKIGAAEENTENADILLDEILTEPSEKSVSEAAGKESEAESDAEKAAESTEESCAENSAGNNENELFIESLETTEDAEAAIDLMAGENIPLTSEYFGSSAFCSFLKYYDTNSDGYLSYAERSTISTISWFNNSGYRVIAYEMKGLQYFPNLKWLFLDNIEIDSIDVSSCTSLQKLGIQYGYLTTLDVSGLQNLTELYCDNNCLTTLDLSNCKALTYLNCSDNNLTALDISDCTALSELDCSSGIEAPKLTTLDVSNCTALAYLNCSGNSLTALDVSNCSTLAYLNCSGNSLTALDVSNCSTLAYLNCFGNNLTTLDLSNCTTLSELDCPYNNLTTLDLSNCTTLSKLNCSDNNLTTLNLSNCTALSELDCSYNNLTSLNVSKCTALTSLNCGSNNLTSLDVSGCVALESLTCANNNLIMLDLSNNRFLDQLSMGTQNCTTNSELLFQETGYLKFNLANLIGADNIGNVTSVNGGTLNNGIVTLDNTSYDESERYLSYSYDTSRGSMYVSLYLTSDISAVCTHAWDDGTVTTAATSTTDEVTTYKCTNCRESVSVSLKAVSFVYNGKEQAVTPIIRDSTGAEITVATSIVYGSADSVSVTYPGPPVNSGNYTVSISVLGKYNLVWHRKFVVKPATIDPLMSSITDSSFIYDGTTKLTGIRIVDYNHNILKSGTDYKISYSPDNVNAGTVKVTVTGIGNYQGSKTSSFRIVPQSITSGQVVLSSASYAYDGKKHQPTVTVKDKDGKTVASKCYTVTYSGTGKKPGTYTVTVKFSGNYQGTVKKTYSVNLAGTSIKSLTASSKGFTVKWKKASKTMNGYQIQYSTSKSFSSKSTKTVKKYTTTSKSITGLKGKKKYYVRIRTYKTISGKKYYSAWSPVKKVTTKK